MKIKASIQDSNIPLQNNGYSQQIDEFDQIFIEISSEKWNIRGGDIDLRENETFLGILIKGFKVYLLIPL